MVTTGYDQDFNFLFTYALKPHRAVGCVGDFTDVSLATNSLLTPHNHNEQLLTFQQCHNHSTYDRILM